MLPDLIAIYVCNKYVGQAMPDKILIILQALKSS